MMDKDVHKYKKDVLRLATFIGQLMLSNGAETYRVDDTVKRICSSRGFTHINVFVAPNTIIVSDDRFDGYTFMKVIENRCINLNKIDLLNDFSRKFVSQTNMSIDDAIEELKNLEDKPPHSQIAINIWTAIGSSSFAALVGGDNVLTFMLTLITSVMAMSIYDKVKKISNIPVFCYISILNNYRSLWSRSCRSWNIRHTKNVDSRVNNAPFTRSTIYKGDKRPSIRRAYVRSRTSN